MFNKTEVLRNIELSKNKALGMDFCQQYLLRLIVFFLHYILKIYMCVLNKSLFISCATSTKAWMCFKITLNNF